MKFNTAFSFGRGKPNNPGSRFRKLYSKMFKTDGSYELVETGVEDVYDSIQKASQGLTVDDLIKRARAGDDTAIGEPLDSYVDLTHVPKDLLEAHSMLSNAQNAYNSLPADLKSKFGNSFESFISACASGEVDQAMQLASTSPVSSQALTAEELDKVRAMIGGNTDA